MGGELSAELVESLQATAREIRCDVIRMTCAAGSGDVGGSLSAVDLLTALVFHELPGAPAPADPPNRDRLVLSKGSAVPALYSAFALRGFLPRDELLDLGKLDSRLQGRADRKRLPFLDASAGGDGQGMGMAVGMALDARLDRRPGRIDVLVGDTELRTGATWEAFLAGAHHRLENLTVVLDHNGVENDGSTEEILGIEPVVDKLRAFRYRTVEIDGHDFPQILAALATARGNSEDPSAIVAHTVSGKGVSFMENRHDWNGRVPSKAEAERALAELGAPAAGAAG
jgi:transketolase